MDFGFSVDPDTITEVAIDKSKRKIYVKEHLYKNGLGTTELAQIIINKVGKKLIIADSSEPRLISDLKFKGVNIKAVKKGTKFTIKLISALIIPVFFIALVIGGYMYSNYLEEEKAQELRVKNIQAFNVMCGTKRLEFEKSISNEKEMCVYKNYKTSTYLDYDETWNVVKNNCSLSYTEVNAYQDWLIKGIACPKEWRNFYDE